MSRDRQQLRRRHRKDRERHKKGFRTAGIERTAMGPDGPAWEFFASPAPDRLREPADLDLNALPAMVRLLKQLLGESEH